MHNKRLSTLAIVTCLAVGAVIAIVVMIEGPPVLASSVQHTAAGATYCVTLEGGGPYTSCNQVFTNLQSAVDAASGGETIKVAAGTYSGVQGRSAPSGYLGSSVVTQVVYIAKDISIRGGYTTTNWSISDPITNPTTLDAQGQGRGVFIAGNITPSIRGLRITGGDAASLGGGFSALSWQGAGGGVYIMTATATLEGNWIFSNTARYGGGLYLNHSNATIRGNTIATNSGEWYAPIWPGYGGGLYLYYSDATLSDNAITSNTTDYACGGLCLGDSDAWLYNNTISHNYAGEGEDEGEGGGLCLYYSDAKLVGNTVSANVVAADNSSFGGGMLILRSNPSLEANLVISNMAFYGGGLALVESSGNLTNTIIADNIASSSSSGLYVESSSLRMWHSTIARNRGEGTGINVKGGSTVALVNTILVSQTVGVRVASGSTVTLEATLWGTAMWANESDWQGSGIILTGTVNHRGNPDFADPDRGDYHIRATSTAKDSAINAGVATDIDGDSRPQGNGYDIGADEYTPPEPVKDLMIAAAFTDTDTLTATLAWSAIPDAEAYTVVYSDALITDDTWNTAIVLTDTWDGAAFAYTAVVPYIGDSVYFALRYSKYGEESMTSNNAFWPKREIYLPLTLRASLQNQ